MTVGGMLDRVAFVAQVHAQQFGDVGVVLDDQHAAGGFHGGSGDGIALLSPIGAAELSHFLSLREDLDTAPGKEWRQPKPAAQETAMTAATVPESRRPPAPAIHPGWLRLTHWLNALAVLVMIASGWRIYNASPLYDFSFPRDYTLGGWLGGALQWHFAGMWLLGLNGLLYLALNLASGRLRRKFFP